MYALIKPPATPIAEWTFRRTWQDFQVAKNDRSLPIAQAGSCTAAKAHTISSSPLLNSFFVFVFGSRLGFELKHTFEKRRREEEGGPGAVFIIFFPLLPLRLPTIGWVNAPSRKKKEGRINPFLFPRNSSKQIDFELWFLFRERKLLSLHVVSPFLSKISYAHGQKRIPFFYFVATTIRFVAVGRRSPFFIRQVDGRQAAMPPL